MGTNYDAHIDACPCCNRGQVVHIGKNSHGWKFTFHGTEEIRTVQHWRDILSKPNTKIMDEYGQIHTCEEFWNRINTEGITLFTMPNDKRGRWDYPREDKDWEDEGFHFCGNEFC